MGRIVPDSSVMFVPAPTCTDRQSKSSNRSSIVAAEKILDPPPMLRSQPWTSGHHTSKRVFSFSTDSINSHPLTLWLITKMSSSITTKERCVPCRRVASTWILPPCE